MNEFELNGGEYFSFKSTIYSHGWIDLHPFHLNVEKQRVDYTFNINSSKKILISLFSKSDKNIRISTKNKIDEHIEKTIASKINKMFRLDENLTEFYDIAKNDKDFLWIPEKGAGRLLRCVSLWEDMVKMLCTTNCTWRLTQIMVENLVNILGSNAFPSPDQIAQTDENFLRERIKMGYRAPYLLEFARNVADGNINLEKIENWQGDSESLYKELRKIKGFGDYAVSSLMKLLGRYDYMGFDSWNRKQFSIIHKNGKKCSDEVIRKFYKKYGKWAGLFFWLDVTKEWYYRDAPWI